MRLCMLVGIEAKVTDGMLAPCWTCNAAAKDDHDIIIIVTIVVVVVDIVANIIIIMENPGDFNQLLHCSILICQYSSHTGTHEKLIKYVASPKF